MGMWYLLSLVATLVELLFEIGVESGLLVGLTGGVALVLKIALDLLVVCPLLTGLFECDILQTS